MNVKTESADEFEDSYRDFSLNIENTNWFYFKIFIKKLNFLLRPTTYLKIVSSNSEQSINNRHKISKKKCKPFLNRAA